MKIPKRELKQQKELLHLIRSDKPLTPDEVDNFYENFNPGMIDSLTENGVFFTPIDLAFDVALFAPRYGHVIDVCGGIGGLSHAMLCRDSDEKKIKSVTIIELNPEFIEIGKRLINDDRVKWICGNAFDKELWNTLTNDLPDNRYDCMLSNPPFGKMKLADPWLNYSGVRDLMVAELCLRYAKSGYFILPSMSTPFKFSGEQYYQEWESNEYKKFKKANATIPFNMSCDGIDCDVFKDQWKNLNGIRVEAVDIQIYPWSLDEEEYSIHNRKIKE